MRLYGTMMGRAMIVYGILRGRSMRVFGTIRGRVHETMVFVQSEWILKHTRHLAICNRGSYMANNWVGFFHRICFLSSAGGCHIEKRNPPKSFPSLIFDLNFVMVFTNLPASAKNKIKKKYVHVAF